LADTEDFGGFDDELVEIERATAILHQRDPSQAELVVQELKARREEELRREEVARKIREIAAKRRRVRKKRIAIVAGMVVVGAAAAIPLARAVLQEAARSKALQAELTQQALPLSSMGFEQQAE